eukprot:TRINITY_DN4424_c0_g1_i3.p1 TRINITY_DN4424_c0_g1~~TRINITY_DN4424_c0_g1_i3.p1  ORF type:complete len:452 (+),score=75.03 TRINITY_DN4424_c0_g1_i3:371-1726(+)
MLALVGYLTSYDARFPFLFIGDAYPSNFYVWLRALPAFCGSCLAPILFLTLREMRVSLFGASLPALFLIFDQCYLLESRIIVTDAVLLCGIAMSYYCWERVKNAPRSSTESVMFLILTGVSMGCCLSTKWTSLGTFGVIGIETAVILFSRLRKEWLANSDRVVVDWAVHFSTLFCIPVFIYVACWVAHIVILKYRPGDGYVPGNRMDPNASLGIWDTINLIIGLQNSLYQTQKLITQPHGSMSNWWSWPWIVHGMGMWGERPPTHYPRATIYMIGNPVSWYSVTASFYFFIFWLFLLPFRDLSSFLSADERGFLRRGIIPLSAYLANWLPYIFVPRVTFLYHYLPVLYSGLILCGLVFDHLLVHAPVSPAVLKSLREAESEPADRPSEARLDGPGVQTISVDRPVYYRQIAWVVFAVGVFSLFVYFLPHTYGEIRLEKAERDAMRWLPGWN